ncbi:MAG TPA: NADH-quinone oxidoreductase subunit C, partial [Thermoanaerobaculia bacterium]|nr:NADH-quinone oxidoreductase subunit C [Thermoanaerobaculia bacterium]
MSSVEAPASTVSFAPLLEKRFPGTAVAETRPAADVPTIAVPRMALREVALFLRDDPSTKYDLFVDLAAIDTSRLPAPQAPRDGHRFQAHVLLYSTSRNAHLRVRVSVPEADAVLPTLTGVWPAANWFEREAWDLMGIRFEGHPNLQRLLTHNGFVGHPLRKDYEAAQRWLCTEEDLLQTQLAAKTD